MAIDFATKSFTLYLFFNIDDDIGYIKGVNPDSCVFSNRYRLTYGLEGTTYDESFSKRGSRLIFGNEKRANRHCTIATGTT